EAGRGGPRFCRNRVQTRTYLGRSGGYQSPARQRRGPSRAVRRHGQACGKQSRLSASAPPRSTRRPVIGWRTSHRANDRRLRGERKRGGCARSGASGYGSRHGGTCAAGGQRRARRPDGGRSRAPGAWLAAAAAQRPRPPVQRQHGGDRRGDRGTRAPVADPQAARRAALPGERGGVPDPAGGHRRAQHPARSHGRRDQLHRAARVAARRAARRRLVARRRRGKAGPHRPVRLGGRGRTSGHLHRLRARRRGRPGGGGTGGVRGGPALASGRVASGQGGAGQGGRPGAGAAATVGRPQPPAPPRPVGYLRDDQIRRPGIGQSGRPHHGHAEVAPLPGGHPGGLPAAGGAAPGGLAGCRSFARPYCRTGVLTTPLARYRHGRYILGNLEYVMAGMAPWAGPMPRQARHLIPAGLPRRGELIAACVVAILVAHLLLAQLTFVLAVTFAVAAKAGRWRPWWLLAPAAAGLAWTLAAGPENALAGFAAGPASILWHLGGGRLAGQPAHPLAGFGGAGNWLPRQLPVALAAGAAEAALIGWLDWLHTD